MKQLASIEILEQRRHLSTSVSFRSGGRIQIITDATAEKIVIVTTSRAAQVLVNDAHVLSVGLDKLKKVDVFSYNQAIEGGADFIDVSPVAATLHFRGTASPETVIGGSGSDTLYGFGGNDVLIGDGGDDFFHGGTGADVMRGKDGIDTVVYDDAPSRVVVRLDNLANDGVDDGAEGDNADGTIENIVGSPHGDRLYGNSRDNMIKGERGNDLIRGGRGNDQLWAGSGRDTVKGDAGFDTYLKLRDGRTDHVAYGFGEDAVGEFDSEMDVITDGFSPF